MRQKINKISSIIFISSTIILMIIVICMILSIIVCEVTNSRVAIDFLLSMTDFLLISIVVSVISLSIYYITEISGYKTTKSNDYNINEKDDYKDQPVYKDIQAERYYIKKTKVNKNINCGRKYKKH